jgi:hypothetical protein
MSVTPVQDLRRIADAVAQLTGLTVQGVEIRADCRQLRLIFSDGHQLLIAALAGEDGRPRLDVDLLRTVDEVVQRQLEVRFDGFD